MKKVRTVRQRISWGIEKLLAIGYAHIATLLAGQQGDRKREHTRGLWLAYRVFQMDLIYTGTYSLSLETICLFSFSRYDKSSCLVVGRETYKRLYALPQPLERNREKRKYQKKMDEKLDSIDPPDSRNVFLTFTDLFLFCQNYFIQFWWGVFPIKVVSSGFFDFRILGTRFFCWI